VEVEIMGMTPQKPFEDPICDPARFRRILNYDQSGRIFRVLPFRRRHFGARWVSVLSELTVGQSGVVIALDLPENVQNHLMHMGFVPDATVTALRRAPAGDPTVYCVDGLEIALRHETAEAIQVRAGGPASGAAKNGSAHNGVQKNGAAKNGASKNGALSKGKNTLAEAAK
jgi:ferrous iron transport protein A